MSQKTQWSFYDPESKMKTEVMSLDAAQMTILKMRTKDVNRFLAWCSEWTNWRKLSEYIAEENSEFAGLTVMMKMAPAVEDDALINKNLKLQTVDEKTQKEIESSYSAVQLKEQKLSEVFQNTGEQFDGDSFDSQKVKKTQLNFSSLTKNPVGQNPSAAKTFKLELVMMSKKGTMFKALAHNVSLTGTFCEKIVPFDFQDTEFDLMVVNNLSADPKLQKVRIKAVITITNGSQYIEFKFKKEDEKSLLKNSLTLYVQELEKAKKLAG